MPGIRIDSREVKEGGGGAGVEAGTDAVTDASIGGSDGSTTARGGGSGARRGGARLLPMFACTMVMIAVAIESCGGRKRGIGQTRIRNLSLMRSRRVPGDREKVTRTGLRSTLE
jgi:hypothetical protein